MNVYYFGFGVAAGRLVHNYFIGKAPIDRGFTPSELGLATLRLTTLTDDRRPGSNANGFEQMLSKEA